MQEVQGRDPASAGEPPAQSTDATQPACRFCSCWRGRLPARDRSHSRQEVFQLCGGPAALLLAFVFVATNDHRAAEDRGTASRSPLRLLSRASKVRCRNVDYLHVTTRHTRLRLHFRPCGGWARSSPPPACCRHRDEAAAGKLFDAAIARAWRSAHAAVVLFCWQRIRLY